MFAINLLVNTSTLIAKWVSAASTRFLLNRQPITAINHGEKAPSGKSLFQWEKAPKSHTEKRNGLLRPTVQPCVSYLSLKRLAWDKKSTHCWHTVQCRVFLLVSFLIEDLDLKSRSEYSCSWHALVAGSKRDSYCPFHELLYQNHTLWATPYGAFHYFFSRKKPTG